jgi:hypothetical protein
MMARQARRQGGRRRTAVFLENPYQVSYVTADLDVGIAAFREQFGVGEFKRLGGDGPGTPVWTPQGTGEMVVKTAVAKIGRLILEIMQPVSGLVDMYRDFLIPGQPLRLHHIAVLTDDIDKVREASERAGRPVVMAIDFAGGRLIYVDARATLGHYLEYVWTEPTSALRER